MSSLEDDVDGRRRQGEGECIVLTAGQLRDLKSWEETERDVVDGMEFGSFKE